MILTFYTTCGFHKIIASARAGHRFKKILSVFIDCLVVIYPVKALQLANLSFQHPELGMV